MWARLVHDLPWQAGPHISQAGKQPSAVHLACSAPPLGPTSARLHFQPKMESRKAFQQLQPGVGVAMDILVTIVSNNIAGQHTL